MIIICEPFHAATIHVEVNAGLIAMAAAAFPAEEILFIGDAAHVALVSEHVARRQIGRVRYRTVELPRATGRVLLRFLQELRLIQQIFAIVRQHQERDLLFAAINSYELVCIKVFLNIYRGMRCIVIPHSLLESLRYRPANWYRGLPFWFGYTLAYGNNRRLLYLVLGPSIEQELGRALPGIRPYVRALELPAPLTGSTALVAPGAQLIRFGYLGNLTINKGGDLFLRLAGEVSAQATACIPEFILIGHVFDARLRPLLTASVRTPSPGTILPRDQYDELIKGIQYAVFFHQPAAYTLTAAATMLDAFAYVKPIIALRNPYFAYYFRAMGDIGYLCDSYDEVYATVLSLLREPPGERYLLQCRNILQGRDRFATPALADHFRGIWARHQQTLNDER